MMTYNNTRRTIPGYHDDYTCDAGGNVYRCDEIMTPVIHKSGYARVCVRTIEGEYKSENVHRLIALAWCSGRDEGRGRNHVDHINADKLDNRAENLRWTTASENGFYAAYEQNLLPDNLKPKAIIAIDIKTCESFEFSSITQAAKVLGINIRHIHSICNGYDHRYSAGGYYFMIA